MTRYSKTMSEALQEVSERASAKRDAMKAMGKNKGIDPADVDTDATDDDVKAASKNIIMQLRKSVSMRGNHNVEFASGKQKVDAKIAQAVQDKFNKIKRPADKQDFQNKIAKSYKDLLLALKEQYEMVEVKEEYVCEDCGCEQGNADPNCSCPNDSTDLQASYWVKKESVDEGFDLDEMKMNDPKLLKMFDKLKKGSKIKLKTSSTISQGKDYVEYIVKSKNLVNKGRVEKITLATVGNEKAVKKFLYKRDGTVGFAIGDMGASIDDFKEDFTPHMMYDPKTGKGYKAEKEADHLRMKDMGYTHEKPEMDEETELDEMREPYAVVDTADGNKVVGTASDEKGAKSIITSSELPPMKIKDKKTLKIVKVKKKQMIGQPIKEEEGPDNRPDSAKEVDAGREDKKKTRIAQLQLQIAKATETINKLNTEEK